MSEPKVNAKNLRLSPLLLLVLLFVGLSYAGFQLLSNQYLAPVDADDHQLIEIVIPENSSARQVASILKEKDLISSEKVFLTYSRRKGLDSQLKAGRYTLSRSQSMDQIVSQLATGQISQIKITIPEGYTVQQIGELLVEKKVCTAEEWQEAQLADYPYEFLEGTPNNSKRLEGYLFPDTYAIDDNTTAQQFTGMMLDRFNSLWTKEYEDLCRSRGMTVNQVITIASLIEREARVSEERKTISGVIQNRLKIGMPLQIDATVLYSLGKHQELVSYRDLEVDSPYNTYKNPGLPPGPIASPGIASIDAALNPEKHNYYYYVSKGDGSHYFSKTLSEHNWAREKYGI
jgi:UPF0755 protein